MKLASGAALHNGLDSGTSLRISGWEWQLYPHTKLVPSPPVLM